MNSLNLITTIFCPINAFKHIKKKNNFSKNLKVKFIHRI